MVPWSDGCWYTFPGHRICRVWQCRPWYAFLGITAAEQCILPADRECGHVLLLCDHPGLGRFPDDIPPGDGGDLRQRDTYRDHHFCDPFIYRTGREGYHLRVAEQGHGGP